jgi:type IV pilus assembly protein PilA
MQRTRGFTLIELMIVIAIIAIISAIAIPNLLQARKASHEAAAIGALRTLNTAQTIFREGDKDANKTLDYATSLALLSTSGNLIDSILAAGTKQGYVFSITAATRFTWSATATPAARGTSGERYFFIDESGVIRFSFDHPGNSRDTPIGG